MTRFKQAWRQTSLPNKLLVLIQLVTFLAVAAYAVETYFLWKISQRSADIASAAVAENKRQFDALQRNQEADAKESSRRFDITSAESKRQSEAALVASQEQANRALEESKRQSIASGRLAKEALEVSRRQITESLRQLESIDRPWITVAVPQSAAFQFRETGDATLGLTFFLKNIGRSPAVNIEVQANVIPLPKEEWINGPFEWQRKICEPYALRKATDITKGVSLAPTEEFSGGFSATLSAQSIAAVRVPPSSGGFYAVLVGCVTYTFTNSLKTHSTGFIYSIDRMEPNDPHAHLIKVLPRGSVEDVELTRFYFGGQQAD